LRVEIASHTRAARRLVEASFGALIGKVDPAQVDAARAATLQTRHRVDEALAAYVGERSAKHVPLAVWGLIARVPILMRLAADAGIAMQRANYTGIESGDPTLHYEQALVVVGASFSDMADRLDAPGYVADAAVAALIADLDMVDGTQKQRDAISAAIVAYTDAHRDDPETISRVMALNWGVGWLAFLAHIRRLADPAIDQVLSQADTPWWR